MLCIFYYFLQDSFFWYLAYEAKPVINDEVTLIREEINAKKRIKLLNIINENFKNNYLEILTIPCAYNLGLRLIVSDKYI